MTFYSFLNYVHNSYDFTDEVKEWENLNDTGPNNQNCSEYLEAILVLEFLQVPPANKSKVANMSSNIFLNGLEKHIHIPKAIVQRRLQENNRNSTT